MRCRTLIWSAVASGLLATSAAPARASLIPYQEATEAMMNSQGLILTLVARELGVGAGGESLSFASNLDPTALSFNYSLATGSTYLGQPASLQVNGAFDGSSGSWLWTSAGQFGSTNLGGSGSSTFSGDPMSVDIFVTISLDETIVSNVTYENTAIRTVSSGTITIKDPILGTVKSSGTHTDEYITTGPNKGKWKWDTGLITGKDGKLVAVGSTGFSPAPDGGLGSFTANVSSVPEPASAGLIGTAGILAGLTCLLRRRIAR